MIWMDTANELMKRADLDLINKSLYMLEGMGFVSIYTQTTWSSNYSEYCNKYNYPLFDCST